VKKSIRKLRLAKDTLHQLDHARSLAGGEDLFSPIDVVRLSLVQSACVRLCITDPPSECPPTACHPEALVPRRV
jgi:hypothetical protein